MADTDPPVDPETPPADPPSEDPPPVDLGDAGKAAIKAERDRAKAAEAALKKLQKEHEELRAANQTDAERALEEARAEGRQAALDEAADLRATAHRRILEAEVIRAAAGKLADPADAVRLLDLEVPDDGEVDTEAIEAAIAELVDQKPYLAATVRQGSGGGGARPAGEPPSVEQQIRDLEAKGDHRAARALKNQGLRAALLNNT